MDFDDDYDSHEDEDVGETDENQEWFSEFIARKKERADRKAKFIQEFRIAPGATHRDEGALCYDPSAGCNIVYSHESWICDHIDHLHEIHAMMQNYIRNEGLYMLDRCTFPDFVGFASRHTTLRYNPYI